MVLACVLHGLPQYGIQVLCNDCVMITYLRICDFKLSGRDNGVANALSIFSVSYVSHRNYCGWLVFHLDSRECSITRYYF